MAFCSVFIAISVVSFLSTFSMSAPYRDLLCLFLRRDSVYPLFVDELADIEMLIFHRVLAVRSIVVNVSTSQSSLSYRYMGTCAGGLMPSCSLTSGSVVTRLDCVRYVKQREM